MNLQFLDFEQPIAELEAKIEELRLLGNDAEINISEEIKRLQQKSTDLTKSIFSSLTPWQMAQLARHPMRPHTVDYIERIFTEFDELHGDRHVSCGPSIVGGIARLDNKPVMVIGHEKGRTTKEKIYRNFGLPNPEAYRKALRLMKLAEKFKLPVITFIDTQGAYPGIEAEERNQSEAIARNLYEMTNLRTPIITTVIGEGGSGGALALGVCDVLLMLQYSFYGVISPEGCASILWRSPDKAPEAAQAMAMTAPQLKKLKLIDELIDEPLGAAHRDYEKTAEKIKERLIVHVDYFTTLATPMLLDRRYQRWMNFGIPHT